MLISKQFLFQRTDFLGVQSKHLTFYAKKNRSILEYFGNRDGSAKLAEGWFERFILCPKLGTGPEVGPCDPSLHVFGHLLTLSPKFNAWIQNVFAKKFTCSSFLVRNSILEFGMRLQKSWLIIFLVRNLLVEFKMRLQKSLFVFFSSSNFTEISNFRNRWIEVLQKCVSFSSSAVESYSHDLSLLSSLVPKPLRFCNRGIRKLDPCSVLAPHVSTAVRECLPNAPYVSWVVFREENAVPSCAWGPGRVPTEFTVCLRSSFSREENTVPSCA